MEFSENRTNQLFPFYESDVRSNPMDFKVSEMNDRANSTDALNPPKRYK